MAIALWLAAWIDGYARVGGMTVTVTALGAMALLAWAVGYVAAIFGVRRVGAMTGEWIARKGSVHAARAGIAAGVGFIVPMAAKLRIGVGGVDLHVHVCLPALKRGVRRPVIA
jgi:uncharacterized protein YqgC (DUF456 family)